MPPFHVKTWHDPDTEGPNDWDGIFQLVSFNTRHTSFRDTSDVFRCDECGDVPGDDYHGDIPADADEWERENYHAYKPAEEIAFMLNYYEHGLCRWYVAPGASPVDMQWDGVYNAGVLLLNIGADERAWWDAKPEDEKREVAESWVREYTAWANGETYGYTIEKRAGTCECCDRELDYEVVDSCGGFIVSWEDRQFFIDEVRGSIAHELGIQTKDVEFGVHFDAEDEFGSDWFE